MKKWKSTFRVGLYKCEMTYSEGGGLRAEWSPKLPSAKEFSPQQMAEYRAGRDAILAEVAAETGSSVMVVE